METFESNSLEETVQLGRDLATRFSVSDCVAIVGPLAAGKTVLVRGIALGLGLSDERVVSSPSYVLVREYAGPTKVYHVDLYRLAAPDAELIDLGIEEMLSDGVVLIEWADRAAGAVPRPRWEIEISPTGPNTRCFNLRRIN